MPMSTAFRQSLSLLVFQNTNVANVGDATGLRGSSTAGSLYVSLHTADPSAGNQSTSECAYTGYARVGLARSSSGWDVSSGVSSNHSATTFGTKTGGSDETATHVGIGVGSSGSTVLLFSYQLDSPISIINGSTPSFPTGDLFANAV